MDVKLSNGCQYTQLFHRCITIPAPDRLAWDCTASLWTVSTSSLDTTYNTSNVSKDTIDDNNQFRARLIWIFLRCVVQFGRPPSTVHSPVQRRAYRPHFIMLHWPRVGTGAYHPLRWLLSAADRQADSIRRKVSISTSRCVVSAARPGCTADTIHRLRQRWCFTTRSVSSPLSPIQ